MLKYFVTISKRHRLIIKRNYLTLYDKKVVVAKSIIFYPVVEYSR